MKTIRQAFITLIALSVGATANMVNKELTIDDLRYVFSENKNKCVGVPYLLASEIYEKNKRENGVFLQHGTLNVIKVSEYPSLNLFYSNKEDCSTLEKDEDILDMAKAFARLNIQIANVCGVRADIKQTFKIAKHLANTKKDNYENIKKSLNSIGLKCKN